MKKFVKSIIILLLLLVSCYSIGSAQTTVKCKNSFAPTFICERYADLTSTFSLTTVITIALYAAIAGAIIFIIWQIVKAIFAWLNKSSDDKSRVQAIKSISNAVIAGIVLIVMLIVVIFGADILGIGGIPTPLYACYPNTVFGSNTALDVDPNTGVLVNNSGNNLTELPDIFAYEGHPSQGASGITSGSPGIVTNGLNDYNETYAKLGYIVKNQSALHYMNDQLYCRDKNTGKERNQGYVILKRVGVEK